MRTINLIRKSLGYCSVLIVLAAGSAQTQLQVPNRPAAALFQGQQGQQKTEVYFDPATQLVTAKILVQDPNGYFIPNLRRENFAVYENGVRQHNATVEIEHAPVTLAVLLEWGGRYKAVADALSDEVPRAARQLLDDLGREDKIALFRYGDRLESLADFSSGHDALDGVILGLGRPEFSELNCYDALASTIHSMQSIAGRKAILAISSGIDTFSKAKFEDVLALARNSGTPVYAIGIGESLRASVKYSSTAGPYTKLDWSRAEEELQEIARASGGRLYAPESTFDLAGIYDDIMENLRVRYAITYKSTTASDPMTARTVRVELIDAKTGGPLEIVDSNGKSIRSKIFFENSYIPHNASTADLSKSKTPAVASAGVQ